MATYKRAVLVYSLCKANNFTRICMPMVDLELRWNLVLNTRENLDKTINENLTKSSARVR